MADRPLNGLPFLSATQLGVQVIRLTNSSDNILGKRGFPKVKVTQFRGPHNKDYSILGSILGSGHPIPGNYKSST